MGSRKFPEPENFNYSYYPNNSLEIHLYKEMAMHPLRHKTYWYKTSKEHWKVDIQILEEMNSPII